MRLLYGDSPEVTRKHWFYQGARGQGLRACGGQRRLACSQQLPLSGRLSTPFPEEQRAARGGQGEVPLLREQVHGTEEPACPKGPRQGHLPVLLHARLCMYVYCVYEQCAQVAYTQAHTCVGTEIGFSPVCRARSTH